LFRYVNVEIPETLGSYIIKWSKIVHEIDREYNNGYAFKGDWLKVGYLNQVQLYDVILVVSRAYTLGVREPGAFVFEAGEQGRLIPIMEAIGFDWAHTVKEALYPYIME